jgi:heat shock protein HslJ
MNPCSSLNPGARSALLAAVMALLGACTTMHDVPEPLSLDGTQWRLVSLPDQALAAAPAITLQFEGLRAFGSDGCNRYTGPYALQDNTLRLGPRRAATLMACPDDVRRRADAFATALDRTAGYRTVDTPVSRQLEMLAADGGVVAVLAAQRQTLAGTRWEVTGVHNGAQAVVSVQPGRRLTLSFDDQGRASGSAGCNRFTTRFALTGSTLRIDPPAATRMSCPEPGVMAQEQAFLRALAAVRTLRIEGDVLELRDDGGALQVSARVDAGGR